ncbi:MAG: O-antigen ligase family protein [Thermotogota bacterium]|nr:O-antigen ligase family protein [Thermotogota bacterium]
MNHTSKSIISKEYLFASLLTFLIGVLIVAGYSLHTTVAFLLVAAGIVTIRDPTRNLILLTILLFPLLPFHVGYDLGKPLPVIKLHRVLFTIIFILWLLDRGWRNCLTSLKEYPLWPLTGYVGLVLLGIGIINGADPAAINYIFSFLIENCLLAFFVFDYFRDEREQRKLLTTLCASGLLIAIMGIIEFQIGFNWYSIVPEYREEMSFALNQQIRLDQNRIRGAFTHAINYGATLAIISACFLSLLLNSKKKLSQFIYIASIGTLLASCYFSLSRGPLLMFIIIFLLVFLWKGKRWLIPLLVLLIVLYQQPFLFTEIKDKLNILITDTIHLRGTSIGGSAYMRVKQLDYGLGFIKQRPFFGYGFAFPGEYISHSIDNFYLRYVLNFGFIGMGTLLILIFAVTKNTLTVANYGKTEFQRSFGVAYLAVICGTIILWFTVAIESYLYWFWIMGGIAMRMRVSIRPNSPP